MKWYMEFCKCGKPWNRDCALVSSDRVNAYEAMDTFENMMKPDHPSGFSRMTPIERRKFMTSGQGMVKCASNHGKVNPSAPLAFTIDPDSVSDDATETTSSINTSEAIDISRNLIRDYNK